MQEPESPMAVVSAEELALAEIQAKWTIAYISNVGRRTGLAIRDDIIGEKLVGTLYKSVNAVSKQDD